MGYVPTCYYLVCHGSKPVRLACLIHTASIHPELGSNSKLKNLNFVQYYFFRMSCSTQKLFPSTRSAASRNPRLCRTINRQLLSDRLDGTKECPTFLQSVFYSITILACFPVKQLSLPRGYVCACPVTALAVLRGLLCLTNQNFGYVCVQSLFVSQRSFRSQSYRISAHLSCPFGIRKAQALARIERKSFELPQDKPSGAMVRGVYMEGVFESRPRAMQRRACCVSLCATTSAAS